MTCWEDPTARAEKGSGEAGGGAEVVGGDDAAGGAVLVVGAEVVVVVVVGAEVVVEAARRASWRATGCAEERRLAGRVPPEPHAASDSASTAATTEVTTRVRVSCIEPAPFPGRDRLERPGELRSAPSLEDLQHDRVHGRAHL